LHFQDINPGKKSFFTPIKDGQFIAKEPKQYLYEDIYPILKLTTAVDGVIWSVQNGTGAASVNYTGTLTATKEGTVTVTAFSKWAPNIKTSKIITIVPAIIPAD